MRSRRHKTVNIHHHHHRRSSGGQALVGGFLGGFMGSVVANSLDEPDPPKPAPKPASDSTLDKLMKYVSAAPVGATVLVTMTEFRLLVDKGLVTYSGTTPHCMDRVLSIK